MEIAFSNNFKRSLRKLFKKHPEIEEKFWLKLEIFQADPLNTSLKVHKLTGRMKDFQSFSITYDCRVIFYFETDTRVFFVDIGSHDEVY